MENEEKKEQVPTNNEIMEIHSFIDKRGFEVRRITPILENINGMWVFGHQNDNAKFIGLYILNVKTGNSGQPFIQVPIQINFPDTIKSLEQAFDTMPAEIEKEIARKKDEAEKMRLVEGVGGGKEIIGPNGFKFTN